MIKDLISVIIPTYNWSSALKLAIKTALWQTYKNIEVIVVGDCCTYDSEEVVKSFGDTRLRRTTSQFSMVTPVIYFDVSGAREQTFYVVPRNMSRKHVAKCCLLRHSSSASWAAIR
jgi:glycosyltransferase involved in cell wall biosynthesis